MAESLTTAHQEWDKRWSNKDDRANWLRPEQVVIDTYAQLAGDEKRLTVADVGCGIGRHAVYYASQGAQVIACDGSPQGLQFAQEAAIAEGVNDINIAWYETDFETIPCEDDHCDLILAWNVIYHGNHDDLRRCLMEMHRAIKPSGFIQLTLLSKRNGNFGVGTEVSPDTWINDSNPEKITRTVTSVLPKSPSSLATIFELFSCADHEHKYPRFKIMALGDCCRSAVNADSLRIRWQHSDNHVWQFNGSFMAEVTAENHRRGPAIKIDRTLYPRPKFGEKLSRLKQVNTSKVKDRYPSIIKQRENISIKPVAFIAVNFQTFRPGR